MRQVDQPCPNSFCVCANVQMCMSNMRQDCEASRGRVPKDRDVGEPSHTYVAWSPTGLRPTRLTSPVCLLCRYNARQLVHCLSGQGAGGPGHYLEVRSSTAHIPFVPFVGPMCMWCHIEACERYKTAQGKPTAGLARHAMH